MNLMLKNLSRAQQQRSTRAHRGSLRAHRGPFFIGLLGLLVLAGLFLFRTSPTTSDIPTNEVEVSVMKATHVSNTDAVVYNSNPPTSGPHDPDWIRPGIYGEAQDKYKLIHSLEHGYIVVHYNCGLQISNFEFLISKVEAHEDDGVATESGTFKADCALALVLADWAKKMELKKRRLA